MADYLQIDESTGRSSYGFYPSDRYTIDVLKNYETKCIVDDY